MPLDPDRVRALPEHHVRDLKVVRYIVKQTGLSLDEIVIDPIDGTLVSLDAAMLDAVVRGDLALDIACAAVAAVGRGSPCRFDPAAAARLRQAGLSPMATRDPRAAGLDPYDPVITGRPLFGVGALYDKESVGMIAGPMPDIVDLDGYIGEFEQARTSGKCHAVVTVMFTHDGERIVRVLDQDGWRRVGEPGVGMDFTTFWETSKMDMVTP